MPLIALILYIVAAVAFALASAATPARVNLVALGLTVFTVAVICQFTVHGAIVA